MKITTKQLKQIIHEELRKKPLKEAASKLPKEIGVTHLGGKSYTLEYQKYGWEPSIQALSATDALLHKVFALIANKIEAGSIEKGTTYVRYESVCYGIGFKSNLKVDKVDEILDKSFGISLGERG
jgi:hypothetical protein